MDSFEERENKCRIVSLFRDTMGSLAQSHNYIHCSDLTLVQFMRLSRLMKQMYLEWQC